MLNRHLRLLALLVILIILIPTNSQAAKPIKSLIVFDESNRLGVNEDILDYLKTVMSHYSTTVDTRRYTELESIDMDGYSHVLVLSTKEGESLSNETANRLATYGGRIYWIGEGAERLLLAKGYDIDIGKKRYGFTSVVYKNQGIGTPYDMGLSAIRIGDESTRVVARAVGSKSTVPFIINHKDIWYMSSIDIADDTTMIFADTLSGFYEAEAYVSRPILYLMLGDITPSTSSTKLDDVLKYLEEQDIPYIIEVNPYYYTEDEGLISLSKVPELTDVIKSSYQDVIIDGRNARFWNEKSWIDRGAGRVLKDMVGSSIYPIGITTPNNLSDEECKHLADVFDILIQDKSRGISIYPFELKERDYSRISVIDGTDISNLDNINRSLSSVSIVGDSSAVLRISVNDGVDGLRKVINLIDKLDLRLSSFKNRDFETSWSQGSISRIDGRLVVNTIDSKINLQDYLWVDRGIDLLVFGLGLVIIVQIIILIRFRIRHRKRIDK